MSRTLFDGALVLTMDDAMTVHAPGHVLVEGVRIAKVGPGPGPRGRADAVIDCAGDILMPAMVNTHAHLAMTLFRGLGEDVDDRLFRYILPLERRFVSPDTVRAGTRLAALETIRGGVGTVADMYYFEEEVGRVLDGAGLRGLVGQTIADFDPPDHASPSEGLARFEALQAEFEDHPRITASIAPHAPYSTGPDVMRACARMRDRTGAPVQMHLAETETEMAWARDVHGTRPVAMTEAAGLLDGLIAAHCLHVDDDEIAAMAAAGARVAHNARSNAKAGRRIAPVTTLRAAGIPVGIATDGPMSGNTLDLLAQLGPVSMLQKIAQGTRGAMPARDVVRMATREGADVLRLEDRIGRLVPGLEADITRVSVAGPHMRPLYDPYAALVFSANAADVADLMVAGRFLMRDRAVLTLDAETAIAEAEEIANRFRAAMTELGPT